MLFVGLVVAGVSLLAGALPARSPSPPVAAATQRADEGIRAALDLLYDGSTEQALERFGALAAERPDDPLVLYFQALALCWKVEQHPELTVGDAEVQGRIDQVLTLTATLPESAVSDVDAARGLLARGGVFGVRSRLALFRSDSRAAGRAAAAMRATLLPLRARADVGADAAFGVGLYDYYADALPRAAKLLRLFLGLPGGDRERGLAAIRSAKAGAAFHGVEAAAQLYQIDAYYEDAPDRALAEIRGLRARYPGSPLWALKLLEHLRDRLARYGESAAVAREILAAVDRGDANFGPGAAALAQLGLGESLLLDLRPSEARAVLLAACARLDPEAALRGRLLVGRSFEWQDDRSAALAHYRAATHATDAGVRHAAERALARPLPEREVHAGPLLAEARRLREAGRRRDSAETYRRALGIWEDNVEARLRVAEDDVVHGRLDVAREALRAIAAVEHPSPAWVGPWAHLLRGFVEDAAQHRGPALEQYKQVLYAPLGDPELVQEATRGLREPFRPDPGPALASPRPHN